MDKSTNKSVRRARRKIGIRKRVSGTAERPRLAVFKSLNHMYAQVIDDLKGHTLVAASTSDADLKLDKKTGNATAASKVGELLAKRAKEKGITDVAFDRGGFRFHGRVKALAEGARKAGLKF